MKRGEFNLFVTIAIIVALLIVLLIIAGTTGETLFASWGKVDTIIQGSGLTG